MKKLIITEKPSVADAIAEALGLPERGSSWIEGETYAISWCAGHLFTPADAAEYDEAWKSWDAGQLPILPETLRYQLRPGSEVRFRTLVRLMDRPDIDGIVNACDAGREGELIFRLVWQHAGCAKPVERLWISSMEPAAVREGLRNLRPDREFAGLFASAAARQEADWLVGINATRLYTRQAGALRRVGRVAAPTLKLLADRCREAEAFQPEKSFAVRLTLGGAAAVSDRTADRGAAEALLLRCREDDAVCESVVLTPGRTPPPALFDLTSLQQEANRRYGYTARQTLAAAQSLYEKRLLTYPRTDSRFLTDDMGEKVLAAGLAAVKRLELPETLPLAADAVLDSGKVGDHHAIIPTLQAPERSTLSEREKNVYLLCARRLVCAMLPAAEYTAGKARFRCGGAAFTAKWRQEKSSGWHTAAESRQAGGQRQPDCTTGQVYSKPHAELLETETKPPAMHTDATLLEAMENAGAGSTGERQGLGTPATRAGILEKILADGLAERRGSTLAVTAAGRELVAMLPPDLTSPDLTCEWEQKLQEICRRPEGKRAFISEVHAFVRGFVAAGKKRPAAEKPAEVSSLGACPRCGGRVTAVRSGYRCENWRECGFSLRAQDAFFKAKKIRLTPSMVRELLQKGRCHHRKLWSKRTGRTYAADILLAGEGRGPVRFSLDFGRQAPD